MVYGFYNYIPNFDNVCVFIYFIPQGMCNILHVFFFILLHVIYCCVFVVPLCCFDGYVLYLS